MRKIALETQSNTIFEKKKKLSILYLLGTAKTTKRHSNLNSTYRIKSILQAFRCEHLQFFFKINFFMIQFFDISFFLFQSYLFQQLHLLHSLTCPPVLVIIYVHKTSCGTTAAKHLFSQPFQSISLLVYFVYLKRLRMKHSFSHLGPY